MADSFQPDSFVPDSFTPEAPPVRKRNEGKNRPKEEQPGLPTEGVMGAMFTPLHGIAQAGQGVKELFTPKQRMRGAADVLEGAGKAMLPYAVPAMMMAPIATATAAAMGYGGSVAGEAAARSLGAGEEGQRLAGDIAAIPAGVMGGKLGGLVSRGARPLARSALGIPAKSEAYGANPGKAILEETRGLRPGKVGESARGKLTELNAELEAAAAGATQPASLHPARQVIADAITKAQAANSASTPRELAPMMEQLTVPQPGFAGAVTPGRNPQIASDQRAMDVLRMKRQFDQDFVQNWNPAANTKGALGVGRQVYREMGESFNRAVPGAEQLNQRMSSLIPVAQRGRLTEMNAGMGERMMDRVARPTGGLAATLMGYHGGGIPGAAATMVGQEAIASPPVKMFGARTGHLFGQPAPVTPSALMGLSSADQDEKFPVYGEDGQVLYYTNRRGERLSQ